MKHRPRSQNSANSLCQLFLVGQVEIMHGVDGLSS